MEVALLSPSSQSGLYGGRSHTTCLSRTTRGLCQWIGSLVLWLFVLIGIIWLTFGIIEAVDAGSGGTQFVESWLTSLVQSWFFW